MALSFGRVLAFGGGGVQGFRALGLKISKIWPLDFRGPGLWGLRVDLRELELWGLW